MMQQTQEKVLSHVGRKTESLPEGGGTVAITHKITLNVVRGSGKERILSSGMTTVRDKILTFLFGPARQVVLLDPGETVTGVVIKEVEDETGNSNTAERSSRASGAGNGT